MQHQHQQHPLSAVPSLLTAVSWRPAPQPDIVRAAQKDDLYLQQSIDACHDAVMRTLGAIPALQHAKSCKLLATFMYYATTTAAGLQTLGEEYCDIMQLSQQRLQHQQQQLAPAHTRVALTLLQSLGPAVLSRLVASLDRASDEGRLYEYEFGGYDEDGFAAGDDSFSEQQQGGMGSAADHEQLLRHEQEDQQQDAACAPTPSSTQPQLSLQQVLQHTRRGWRQLQQYLSPHWPAIKSWLLFAGRVHLAAFYLRGHYYEWAKRLLGVRYTSISPNREQRASYRFLGYMLVVQLVVSGLMQARAQLAAAAAASQGDSSSGSGLLGAAGQGSAQDQHARLLPDPVLQDTAACADVCSGAGSSAHQAAGVASSSSHTTTGKQCPLCLSVRSHPTCTPCGHVFCWQCIAQWCLEKPECPLCRTGVVSSQLVCLYHSDM